MLGDGGPATSAKLYNPSGVTVDGSGNVYVADTNNNRIRKISAASGVITTFAGTGTGAYGGDGGPAALAQLSGPTGVAMDSSGNVYIVDASNGRIRKISASNGVITTIAGASGELHGPSGIAVDRVGHCRQLVA